jgi:hypothetical protein
MAGKRFGGDLAQSLHERFNVAIIQQVFDGNHPEFVGYRIRGRTVRRRPVGLVQQLRGKIDEVAVYRRALKKDEIARRFKDFDFRKPGSIQTAEDVDQRSTRKNRHDDSTKTSNQARIFENDSGDGGRDAGVTRTRTIRRLNPLPDPSPARRSISGIASSPPESTLTRSGAARHLHIQKGRFSSRNNGHNWPHSAAFADASRIMFSHILKNGNILFATRAKSLPQH